MTAPISLTGTIACTPPLTSEQWANVIKDGYWGWGLGQPLGRGPVNAHMRFAPVLAHDRIAALAPVATATDTAANWASDLHLFLAALKDFGYREYGKPPAVNHFTGHLHGQDTAGQRYAVIADGLMVDAMTIEDPAALGRALVRAARRYLAATDADPGEEVDGYHRGLLAQTFDPATRPGRHRSLLSGEYLDFVDQCYRPHRVLHTIHHGHLADALGAQRYTYAGPAQAIAAAARTLAAMLGVEDAFHHTLRDLAAQHGTRGIDPRSPKRQAMLLGL